MVRLVLSAPAHMLNVNLFQIALKIKAAFLTWEPFCSKFDSVERETVQMNLGISSQVSSKTFFFSVKHLWFIGDKVINHSD